MTFAIVGGGQLDTGYTIDNSLRYNNDDSPELSRTPSSAGNKKTFTFSTWLKRGELSSNSGGASSLLVAGITTNILNFRFQDSGILNCILSKSGSTANGFAVDTDAVFRDVSAYYHILLVVDTTQASITDAVKIYVNNTLQSFSSSSYGGGQNVETPINDTLIHSIGYNTVDNNQAFDGYLAETYLIDGQALSPTSFGEFDEDSGIWKPIRYSGSYGTNGFYLDFENSGSLGADQSGNGNNFTPTNLASTDQTTDTPTNNFATMNPLRMSTTDYLSGGATQGTFSEGNLKVLGAAGGTGSAGYMNESATFTMDKFYAELRIEDNNGSQVGVMDETYFGGTFGALNGSGTICISGSNISRNNSNVYTGLSYSAGDVIGVAMNHTSEKVWFSINGVWQGSGTQNPATGDGGYSTSGVGTNMFFAIGDGGNLASGGIANFGQEGSFAGNKTAQGNADGNGYGDFYYAPPTGFLALCTQNLATELSPTIDDGSQYFNTVLYTGTGSSLGVTGVGFQPDWTWIKGRSGATEHVLTDSSRGVTEELNSNDNSAEETVAQGLTAFGTDGFTVGTDGSYNTSSATYASWNWLANAGSTSSNTDGSITSTVQANPTAGFSIVTYTGTGSNATVGHGLGVAPKVVIIKSRSNSGTSWAFGSDALTNWNYSLELDTTDAEASVPSRFNGTAPTSSVFSIGGSGFTGETGYTYVAYCFAEIEGYSKFGSYTGNGNADGPFIYTGFRPAFVIIKRTDSALSNWFVYDTARDTFNVADAKLEANDTDAEVNPSSIILDILSNGFKQRSTNSQINASGGTYIYMAFAESPFVTSTSIPVTAR